MDGIGAGAGAQHGRVVQGLRHFLVPHVGGDFDNHGSAAAILQFGKGAAKDVGDFGSKDDRLGRFRKRLHCLARIEVRLDVRNPPRIAHRHHQHRHGFAETLRDAAHGIFRAGSVLHAERTDRASRGDPGDRIRHVQADAFLPHHDGTDIGVGGILDQMIDRIAAQNFDALALEDFRNRGAEFHAIPPQNAADCSFGLLPIIWNRNQAAGKAPSLALRRSPDMHPRRPAFHLRRPFRQKPECHLTDRSACS